MTYKATYADGTTVLLDEDRESPGTHYGDGTGKLHRLVSYEPAADAPAVPAPSPYGQG